MTMDTTRRRLLKAAPAVGLTACLPALVEAAPSMTRDALIAHHHAEIFRLLAETVPEGTVLESVMLDFKGPPRFIHLTAFLPGRDGDDDPFFSRTTRRGPTAFGDWEFSPGRAS